MLRSVEPLLRIALARLGPDDHVLEIGTGWGALAVHAARQYGCRVTTTTISREQYDLARERVRGAGLEDRITVLLEDYRDLRGSYDKLVSIEMIEAVGWRHFGTFFAKCSELLAPDGARVGLSEADMAVMECFLAACGATSDSRRVAQPFQGCPSVKFTVTVMITGTGWPFRYVGVNCHCCTASSAA